MSMMDRFDTATLVSKCDDAPEDAEPVVQELLPPFREAVSHVEAGGWTDETTYTALYKMDNVTSGYVAEVLNSEGAAHATACPLCHADDFQHVKGCRLW